MESVKIHHLQEYLILYIVCCPNRATFEFQAQVFLVKQQDQNLW